MENRQLRAAMRHTVQSKLKPIAVLALALCMAGAGALGQQVEERRGVSPPVRTDRYGDPPPAGATARLGPIRFRNAEAFRTLAYTSDGRFLVAGSSGALILDAKTGKEVRRLGAELPNPWGPAVVSPDGRLVAVSGWGPDMGGAVYESATGRRLCRLGHPSQNSIATCFSPDGKILAAHNMTDAIDLYDPNTGKLLRSLQWRPEAPAIGQYMNVAFTPDGRTLISAGHGSDGIRFWDVATGKEVRRLPGNPNGIIALALSPDGARLASVAVTRIKQGQQTTWFADNRVHVLDVLSGKEILHFDVPAAETIHGRPLGPYLLAFTPDGKELLTGGKDHTLRVWDSSTGKELRHFADFRCGLNALAFTPDGKAVAVSEVYSVRVRDLATGRDRFPTGGHRSRLSAVAASPDGRTVATASLDGAVLLWDGKTGRELRHLLAGYKGWVIRLIFSPDGQRLFLFGIDRTQGNTDNVIRAWDAATGRELWQLQGRPGLGRALALSPDGKVLAAPAAKTMLLFDAATGKQLRTFAGPEDSVVGMSFTPDGRTLLAWAHDRWLYRWDVASGKHTRRFCDGLGRYGWVAAFSPDGRFVAVDSHQRRLALVDVATIRELRQIVSAADGPAGSGFCVAFSPDGRSLAWAGSQDHEIRLVEVATGKERRRFPGHHGQVEALAFTPDGKGLVSGADDTTALVWDLLHQ
jgi:WD40 repeat protein